MFDDIIRDPVAVLLGGLIVFGFACLAASDLWSAWTLRRESRRLECERADRIERAMQDRMAREAQRRLARETTTRRHLEDNPR